jgi:hypothetical protein
MAGQSQGIDQRRFVPGTQRLRPTVREMIGLNSLSVS